MRISHIANAFRQLDHTLLLESKGIYGHTIVIKTGDIIIKSSELDVEFDIPFDDDTEANESEIVVYNLTASSINKMKKGERLTITAGYQGDTGLILSGCISRKVTRYEGSDKKTVISVMDDNNRKEHEVKSIAFKKGCKASYILKKLAGEIGLPIAVFQIKRDHTYKDKVNVDGGLMENISRYAKVCGVSAYICKGKVYVRSLKDGDALNFMVSDETGLLSVEEFEEESTSEEYTDHIKGLNITMLLQHRITTAGIICLQSRYYNGTYRVRSGRHTYDGTDFTTEIEVV